MGEMAVRMRKVLARQWVSIAFVCLKQDEGKLKMAWKAPGALYILYSFVAKRFSNFSSRDHFLYSSFKEKIQGNSSCGYCQANRIEENPEFKDVRDQKLPTHRLF